MKQPSGEDGHSCGSWRTGRKLMSGNLSAGMDGQRTEPNRRQSSAVSTSPGLQPLTLLITWSTHAPDFARHDLASAVALLSRARETGNVWLVRNMLNDRCLLAAMIVDANWKQLGEECAAWLPQAERYEKLNGEGSLLDRTHPAVQRVAEMMARGPNLKRRN